MHVPMQYSLYSAHVQIMDAPLRMYLSENELLFIENRALELWKIEVHFVEIQNFHCEKIEVSCTKFKSLR